LAIATGLLALGMAAAALRPAPSQVRGAAHVIDPATVEIDGRQVRLFGVVPPDATLACRGTPRTELPCVIHALAFLQKLTAHHALDCRAPDGVRTARDELICYLAGTAGPSSVNSELVRAGVLRSGSDAFREEEIEARSQCRGVWALLKEDCAAASS
jgi:endonuclease YncB( thermonuclease family)